ncbi:hypothetical protein NERG_02146 [Nematocida ausubeli]|uniref:Uncharacterized protein n=1 Tax=Nematocida ausubeli (strain ATCC PRA-371 / ERTm2) TaxID=1913371 RepID=H8ZEX7_NEMA1|nr:hypothetical protein NERG_02146 [Nematocida ausubeli]
MICYAFSINNRRGTESVINSIITDSGPNTINSKENGYRLRKTDLMPQVTKSLSSLDMQSQINYGKDSWQAKKLINEKIGSLIKKQANLNAEHESLNKHLNHVNRNVLDLKHRIRIVKSEQNQILREFADMGKNSSYAKKAIKKSRVDIKAQPKENYPLQRSEKHLDLPKAVKRPEPKRDYVAPATSAVSTNSIPNENALQNKVDNDEEHFNPPSIKRENSYVVSKEEMEGGSIFSNYTVLGVNQQEEDPENPENPEDPENTEDPEDLENPGIYDFYNFRHEDLNNVYVKNSSKDLIESEIGYYDEKKPIVPRETSSADDTFY